jgi:lactate permease
VTWTQNYVPLGNLFLSAAVAALPVVVLLGALAFFHIKAHLAALLGLAVALGTAVFVYGMPGQMAAGTAVYGAAYGLFPIGWIVLNAIFIYDITVKTGKFEVVKQTIAALGGDRRIQVLLIAFAFGAFIEGAAGFGTPVAISAAMLIGLGFRPLQAAGLALIGNTAPVAYGALGTPIIVLAKVTGLDLLELSAMAGRQLPFFSVIVPFWLVWAMAGFRGMIAVWPACLVAGVSFAVPQFLVSNYHGPWLVDIIAAASCIGGIVLFLKFWQPKEVFRFDYEKESDAAAAAAAGGQPARSFKSVGAAASQQFPTRKEAWMAWMPWVMLSVFVFIWGLPQVKDWFNAISAPKFPIPGVDKLIMRAPPIVPKPTPESAVFVFNWLSATGTGLMLSGIVSGLILGIKPGELLRTWLGTLKRVRYSLLTIGAMLALGFVTKYAGSDSTMGLAFAATGGAFAFFSPLLGWLGVALTGSDTSSNVLFGNLQVVTANQVGISPLLAAASNSSGGVMGKMIDAQSIVVAGVATGQEGQEGPILRYVFWHSLALAAMVGVLVYFQAYYWTSVIPGQ